MVCRIFLLLLFWSLSVKSENRDSQIIKDSVSGLKLSIYLPATHSKEQSYKTLYFLDGKHIFGRHWGLKEKLDGLITQGLISPLIVVGVHETENRKDELLPYNDSWIRSNWGKYRPRADKYSQKIHEKLIPYIEEKYSASKSIVDRALFGISFGGLFASWDASENNKAWGMVAAISPSYWVKEYQFLKSAQDMKLNPQLFWFDIGTSKHDWNSYESLIPLLEEKGFIYGENLYYFEDPGAIHAVPSWKERIHLPILLFAGSQSRELKEVRFVVDTVVIDQNQTQRPKMNPVLIFSDGFKYSASSSAKYSLETQDEGASVSKTGILEYGQRDSLNVKVEHALFTKSLNLEKNIEE